MVLHKTCFLLHRLAIDCSLLSATCHSGTALRILILRDGLRRSRSTCTRVIADSRSASSLRSVLQLLNFLFVNLKITSVIHFGDILTSEKA